MGRSRRSASSKTSRLNSSWGGDSDCRILSTFRREADSTEFMNATIMIKYDRKNKDLHLVGTMIVLATGKLCNYEREEVRITDLTVP